jgi:hypothetical protein
MFRDERIIGFPRQTSQSRRKVARFGFEPLTEDACALLAVSRPVLREAVPRDIVGSDAEGLLYDLGGAIRCRSPVRENWT